MFGKPLLAHPSERGVHTTSNPHSGDDDDRDHHDDEADDEQHRVLAVTNVLSRRMVMFAFLHSPVCALVHSGASPVCTFEQRLLSAQDKLRFVRDPAVTRRMLLDFSDTGVTR